MTVLEIQTPRVFAPLLAPARYKGAHGGRGSGKSHFFGELWLEENVSEKFDFVCLRETLKSLEFSVKKLLEAKIETFNAGGRRCTTNWPAGSSADGRSGEESFVRSARPFSCPVNWMFG